MEKRILLILAVSMFIIFFAAGCGGGGGGGSSIPSSPSPTPTETESPSPSPTPTETETPIFYSVTLKTVCVDGDNQYDIAVTFKVNGVDIDTPGIYSTQLQENTTVNVELEDLVTIGDRQYTLISDPTDSFTVDKDITKNYQYEELPGVP